MTELPWPGNIRELKNLVERAVLVSGKNTLDIHDFMDLLHSTPQMIDREQLPAVGTMSLDDMEKAMIRKAMEFHKGNISKVARLPATTHCTKLW